MKQIERYKLISWISKESWFINLQYWLNIVISKSFCPKSWGIVFLNCGATNCQLLYQQTDCLLIRKMLRKHALFFNATNFSFIWSISEWLLLSFLKGQFPLKKSEGAQNRNSMEFPGLFVSGTSFYEWQIGVQHVLSHSKNSVMSTRGTRAVRWINEWRL